MLKQFSKGLILSLLTCASAPAFAAPVSVEDAKQLAADFFSADNSGLASIDALDLAYTAGTVSKPHYYVFNARDGKGYIIISADDTTAPVLGYSTDGSYNAAAVPPAMKWMLSGLENEIKAAPSLKRPFTAAQRRNMVARRAGRAGERILLPTASWSQESPFNAAIPGRPLVGCVGTAMAIIMKYHQYPERGTGSYNGVSYDVAYDWDNMRTDNYRSGYTPEEAEAVATLMYHAASSIGTQFGMSGSSAYEVKVPAALTNYFGYDPGVSYKKRSEVSTQSAFDAIVIEEIKNNRPVLYCGQDVTVGHAFVVDGYDPATGMLHINWGWGGADGNYNGGWYASTALNPTVSQSHHFNNLTTIIYNIKKGDGNNAAWSPIHLTADGGQPGIGSDMTSLAPGKKFTLRAGTVRNVSHDRFSGKIAVALFDAAGAFKTLLSSPQGLSLDGITPLWNGYIDFRNCELPSVVTVAEGDMVRLATTTDDTNWLPVPGELLTVNEIPALRTTVETFAVNFPASLSGATFKGDNSVIRGWNYAFSVTPDNAAEDVITVKANGLLLTPAANTFNYSIDNVREDQTISVLVQKASEVKAKRSVWVEEAGTLSSIIPEDETGIITDLTLFGSIDARDFDYMREKMNLKRLDISSVYIAANGSNQANAIPRNAFKGKWSLSEILLPRNINRINNGAFRQCGITSITIPAGVSTYEYNVFLGSNRLRDVWMGREKAEFINWCVFSGARTDLMTLHVPNQNAVNNYSAKEYWKDIKNIIIDPIPAQNDFAFAVMENADVKFETETTVGRYPKGTNVIFTAEHIAENDNRMAVYANSTLLTPDAQGVYSVTINSNTIIHFDLIKPMETASYDSPWQLTNTGGTVGLLTDAVNIFPGIEFTIRANALNVPADATSMFWAAVLTDADGKIKEFISPVSTWGGAKGDGLKMNVKCCVKESNVREGNLIRLATSYNKKRWALVGGRTDDVIDRLPALNNQTPVYNMTYTEGLADKANVSGAVATAVYGRDITLKVTPKQASHMINAVVNGDTIVKGAKTFSYSFIAKQDMNFDINVYPPVSLTEATITLAEGEHLYLSGFEGIDNWGEINHATAEKYRNIKKLTIKGKLDYYDFGLFRENYWVAANIRFLDLSEATIVRDRDKDEKHGFDHYFPSYAFYNNQLKGCYIEEIILPQSVKQFGHDAFKGCSRLKEIELPKSLRNWGDIDAIRISTGEVYTKTGSGLEDDVFLGCTSLETIYLPCVPGNDGNVGHLYYSQYHPLRTGLPDNAKVTVVVPAEHLETYKTPRVDNGWYNENWSNGWEAGGFNIVGQYPVYSLGYDASRCFVTDKNLNVDRAASFLKDNISLESLTLSDKLYIGVLSKAEGRPEGVDTYKEGVKVKVYDNGKLMPEDAVNSNGAVSLTYWNPNKHADKAGNHDIDVIYLYDVTFNCMSDQFTVNIPEIRNNETEKGDEATLFETLNYYNASAPVLENVNEDSAVKFSLGFSTDNKDIQPRVKIGSEIIEPDEDGFYTINVTDNNVTVDIYAVPSNGATLTTKEIVSINAAEAVEVTDLSLEGNIDSETLATVVEGFESLSSLDLSGMSSEIPAGAFEGKTTLTEVILPEVETIEPNTFKDCESLQTVTVPESVTAIGEGAFSGCSSLESITLTGIDAIGASAFSGCDNLTTITINPASGSAPAAIKGRNNAPRATGFDETAFEGVNPNCLIILGEGVAVPATTAGNYLTTRVGEIPDVNEEGQTTTRQGRIYESAGDISLRPGYPFATANRFSMIDGNAISYVAEVSSTANGWNSLVIPFNVDKVTSGSTELVAKTSPEQDSEETDYMVASLDVENNRLALTKGISANVPYLIKQTNNNATREITFTAADVTVEPTPETVAVNGADYSLAATFSSRQLPGETTYVLNADGNAFELVSEEVVLDAEGNEEPAVTSVNPWEVYAVSDKGQGRIEIAVAGDDTTTGISNIDATTEGVSVTTDGGNLVIYSDKAVDAAVYYVDGRLVGTITLNPGRNVITELPRGIYIVAGYKVAL